MLELLTDVRARLEENSNHTTHLVVVPGILAGLNRSPKDSSDLSHDLTPPTIAAGGDQKIGDVVVAEFIFPLTIRHQAKEAIFNGRHLETNIANDAELRAAQWQNANPFQVHIGTVAGGYGLINNAKTRMAVQSVQSWENGKIQPIIAVEMESDVYARVQRNLEKRTDAGKIVVLFAKAISDWAIGKTNGFQTIAASNSVSFVQYCLETGIGEPHGFKKQEIDDALKGALNKLKAPSATTGDPYHGHDTLIGSGDNFDTGIVRQGDSMDPNTVKYWISRFTETRPPLRLLIVNGPAGRGKTFFAEQIRHGFRSSANPEISRWRSVWWDCGSGPFSPRAICTLLVSLLPDALQQEYAAHAFSLSDKDKPEEDEFAEDSAITKWLRKELFDKPEPICLYLDDLDRYKANLGADADALTSFLKRFLQTDSALRVIATSRDSGLDIRIREVCELPEDQVGESGDEGDELRPFTDTEAEEYLRRRLTSGSAISFEIVKSAAKSYIPVFGGEPLTLRLFSDAATRPAGKTLSKVLEVGWEIYEREQAKGQDEKTARQRASKAVRDELFSLRFEQMAMPDRNAVKALAFLTEERFNVFELRPDPELRDRIIQWVPELVALVKKSGLPDEKIVPTAAWAQVLEGKGILRPWQAAPHLNDPTRIKASSELRIDFDAFREYLVETHRDSHGNAEWHKAAAAVFKTAAQRDTNEDYLPFETWHLAHTDEDGQAKAFAILILSTLRWESSARWLELLRLYLWFRQLYWTDKSWRRAFVQVKTADILYTAFDNAERIDELVKGVEESQKQDEWDLNTDGLATLQRAVASFKRSAASFAQTVGADADLICRVLEDAYLRAVLLKTVHAFESNPRVEGVLKPSDKGERRNEEIVKEVNKAIQAIEDYRFDVYPTRKAILYNFRGCFYNGYGQFDNAVRDFSTAEQTLSDYEKWFRSAQSSAEPVGGNKVSLDGFRDDRLDIANNWSRTRFLQAGPYAAINGVSLLPASAEPSLKEIVSFETLMNQLKESVRSHHTFAYSLIDLVYYFLAAGEPQKAREWLNESYNDLMEPEYLPAEDSARCVRDKWTEAYFDALEAAYSLYRLGSPEQADYARAMELMQDASNRFSCHHFDFIRDQMIIACNAPLIQIAATVDIQERKAYVDAFEAMLERKMEVAPGVYKTRTIKDEPLVKDTLIYLRACARSATGIPEPDAEGAVERTQTRFPVISITKERVMKIIRSPVFLNRTGSRPCFFGALYKWSISRTRPILRY